MRCVRDKRSFTLLEMMVALFILSIVGTLVTIQVSKLIQSHRFEKEVAHLLIGLQEAQVLATTYQTDLSLDLFVEKGVLRYRFSTDEPLATALFRQDPISLALVKSAHFHQKKIQKQHFEIYSSGMVEPKGVIQLSAGQEGPVLYLDLQASPLLKLCRTNPAVLKQTIPSKPK